MPPLTEQHRRNLSEATKKSWASGTRKPPRSDRANPWQHGTIYGYATKRCRCPLCREANRVHVAAARARRRARA